MEATKSDLRGAPIIDFTGTASGVTSMKCFDDDFIAIIRSDKRPTAVVIIDRAVGLPIHRSVVVQDHLNLTGTSPLCGANDPCGERFPVLQGIYVHDALPDLPRVLVAGLKHGIRPDKEETKLITDLGADVCCYNVVPAMIVAAHARCQVLAILIPEGSPLPDSLLQEIKQLTGEK